MDKKSQMQYVPHPAVIPAVRKYQRVSGRIRPVAATELLLAGSIVMDDPKLSKKVGEKVQKILSRQ